VTTVVIRRHCEPSGLRPVDPVRDIVAVADLIQAAFADDLDQTGHAMLREMRAMGRLGPLLWWFDSSSSGLSRLMSGFVWVEEGQIAGNVTVTQSSHWSDRWIISNVAVARAHRGRGIARSLMNAALDLIRQWHGKVVTLQVRDDNAPALHLYETIGFQSVFGTAYLCLDQVAPVQPVPLPNVRPRRLTAADAGMAYRLVCAATPAAVQTEQPIRSAHYQLGLETRLKDWLRPLIGKAPGLRLVVENQGCLEAAIVTEPTDRSSESQIELAVHPDSKGRVEKQLIGYALCHLNRWSQRTAVARHPTYHPEGIEAFKSFGFRADRTLLWMKCEL
jgi:ribosomal protein S18 acetylase RimI-like enzyme